MFTITPNEVPSPYTLNTVKTPDSPRLEVGQSAYESFKDEGDWFSWLERKAKDGDPDAIDKLLNWYLTEKSNDTARKYTAEREDSRYQRMVEDLRKAGINPAMLFMNGGSSPSVSGSTGSSYSSTGFAQSSRNKDDNIQGTFETIIKSLITFAGTALMVMAMAA